MSFSFTLAVMVTLPSFLKSITAPFGRPLPSTASQRPTIFFLTSASSLSALSSAGARAARPTHTAAASASRIAFICRVLQ
jgi:hypothetical protein